MGIKPTNEVKMDMDWAEQVLQQFHLLSYTDYLSGSYLMDTGTSLGHPTLAHKRPTSLELFEPLPETPYSCSSMGSPWLERMVFC